MAEILQRDGAWVLHGDALRLTPGRHRSVSPFRRTLGELDVPLRALAGVSFEQGRRAGRLRLRLRDGADPLLHATGGRLGAGDDPYRLLVDADRYGVAGYVAEEVRGALRLDAPPAEPVAAWLLPGPAVPVSASAGDGTASFDGERVRLEWNRRTEDAKAAAGARTLPVADIAAVEWRPATGPANGFLRFTVRGAPCGAPPRYDPHAVELWGFRGDPLTALVAAAVRARLPHPRAAGGPGAAPASKVPAQAARPPAGDGHDALLRRLRELGELRRAGVLTDAEFTLAKRAVLRRL
ncbi:DUF4429 domain-containing protein [Streptomyces mangrovisoli]|uniref:Tat pathway signal sequence domain protein n=1 Tax=Streptomyces mangrovisoli TaxID=1428628 RepID=A0A1J4NWT2_9ACTN|nr:DUF4429 domain-containing protein [Streptomyces mangrovisoli]OIJ65693.1 Tat pathway signal sequence domain protein [Streptomyces mangrovisoli]